MELATSIIGLFMMTASGLLLLSGVVFMIVLIVKFIKD